MLIDWFTVMAQVINFIVLVWLLRRFLYKPVLRAIDDREKLIAGRLRDAAARSREATRQYEEFSEKNKALNEQRTVLMARAAEDASIERSRLFEEARRDMEGWKAAVLKAETGERQEAARELRRRIETEVFALARKACIELADGRLENQVVTVFLNRLQSMSALDKANLQAGLKSSTGVVLVRSAFALEQEQQEQIGQAIAALLETTTPPAFEVKPELIAGIELSTDGHTVSWNLSDYLGTVEEKLDQLDRLDSNSTPRS